MPTVSSGALPPVVLVRRATDCTGPRHTQNETCQKDLPKLPEPKWLRIVVAMIMLTLSTVSPHRLYESMVSRLTQSLPMFHQECVDHCPLLAVWSLK